MTKILQTLAPRPLREAIRHGEHGTLTDFFDADQLANHMLTALADPAAGDALRSRARERAEHYALANGLAQYLQLLGLEATTALAA